MNASNRRHFLQATATSIAAAPLALTRSVHAAGSEQIKVALIGCGGRGNGAVNDCLNADPAVTVVAVADAFENRAAAAAKRLRKEQPQRAKIADDHVFWGLDAYLKAIEAGPDLIVTASPPGFRPLIYAAAIKAGKHVFMEKPCCVDAAGYRILQEANALADEKKLKVGVGFQRRHTPSYIETIKKIHDGELGELTLLRAYWNGGGIWNRPRAELAKTLGREPTELEYQVHNWYHFCWLSGDNICEQHIHNLDVCNWVWGKDGDPQKAHPVEANGMGACVQRYKGNSKGTGQIFDEHFVEFTFADGTKMFSQCRHIPNTWSSVSEAVHGVKGESNPAGSIKFKDGASWNFKSGKKGGVNSMVQEHKDLIDAIRDGSKYNEGWRGAASSMTAVLGRLATYSGSVVKWDEAVAKGKSEFPETLDWKATPPVKPDANGDYPIPIPGVYKAY